MAKIPFGCDIDLGEKNQIINFRVNSLATAPVTTGWGVERIGYMYYNTTSKMVFFWDGTQFVPGEVPTNLAMGTVTATTQIITNSNGTGITLIQATTANAGLLSAADKVKLNAAILSTTTDVSLASWVVNENTFASNSATKVPTQASVKAYIDNLILTNGSLVYQTGYAASTNTPKLSTTPIAGIKKGWTYVVTDSGNFFSVAVEAGDMLIALQDTPTLVTHWTIVNKNIPDVLTILLTGFVSGAGTITSSDSILSAIQKLDGNMALKAPLASPTFTGVPAVPTPAVDTSTTQVASTAFVIGQAGGTMPVVNGSATPGVSKKYSREDHVHPIDPSRAPVASPGFTGTPTAPTAAMNTNTTQIATTAFVMAQTAGNTGKAVGTLPTNGVVTSITVSHSLGSDVLAKLRAVSDNSEVECEVIIGAGSVTFNFNTAPVAGAYKYIIIG